MDILNDGIFGMLPEDKMTYAARKLRDVYNIKPNADIYQREFGFYCLEKWAEQGKILEEVAQNSNGGKVFKELFKYDDSGSYSIGGLGWCEAEFCPAFPEVIIEDRGEHEVVQDFAGRYVLYFKGRRSGFMPEYIDNPVKDMNSWIEKCKWRLNPKTPERYVKIEEEMKKAVNAAKQGLMITQGLIGGYMYLRSLIGPEKLFYMFYDDPELIHDCMKTWLELADAVIAKHQKYVTLDELFIAEDICYNHGPLISPDMIREFLFPYYKQLLLNIKARQLDPDRHLYFQVDTDGFAESVIPVYQEIGMDVMSPFEVASGSDVVNIGNKYPNLVISGGIDKRILAKGKDAIDKHLNYILPAMKARGGYIPTCDHGVPEEVSFESYSYFRKRCLE